jgi:hypothetical protein
VNRSMKSASTLSLAGFLLALFATNVSAQPPGPMGPGRGMGGGMMMKHMRMMDQDGDGKISQQEFSAFHEKRFAQMDTNGDGFIDSAELTALMNARMKGGMMPVPSPQGGASRQSQGQPTQ